MPGPVASGDRAVGKTDTIATLGAHRSREGDTDAVMEAGHAPFPPCSNWGFLSRLVSLGGWWPLERASAFFLLSPGSATGSCTPTRLFAQVTG